MASEKADVVKAAEKHPDSAKETNPVAEATPGFDSKGNLRDNKDPYAMGEKITNPEPNNGSDQAPSEKAEVKESKKAQDKVEQTAKDQKVADKKADNEAKAAAKK